MKEASWATLTSEELRSGHIDALLAGEVAYVRVRGFFDSEWCAEIKRRFLESSPAIYETLDYGFVKVLQLGMSSKMVMKPEDDFFAKSARVIPRLRRLYRGGDDPLLKVRGAMERCGWSMLGAKERTGPYCSDMIWALRPGSELARHRDSSTEKTKLWIHRFSRQLTWNLYISSCAKGGELVVYQTSRKPGRKLETTGRATLVVPKGTRAVQYEPEIGDLVVFVPGNYHEVLPNRGEGHRITAHSFIGLDPESREMAFFT
jgi:hypothetical protein